MWFSDMVFDEGGMGEGGREGGRGAREGGEGGEVEEGGWEICREGVMYGLTGG